MQVAGYHCELAMFGHPLEFSSKTENSQLVLIFSAILAMYLVMEAL